MNIGSVRNQNFKTVFARDTSNDNKRNWSTGETENCIAQQHNMILIQVEA